MGALALTVALEGASLQAADICRLDEFFQQIRQRRFQPLHQHAGRGWQGAAVEMEDTRPLHDFRKTVAQLTSVRPSVAWRLHSRSGSGEQKMDEYRERAFSRQKK